MKTWISVFGTGLAALMLVGCKPSEADKAKDKVDQEKKDKINAVKTEAEMKKDAIDVNANAAAKNLDAAAEQKRKEAEALEKKANEVK